MEVFSTLPAFLLAVLLISASPGPAMALIFRRAALRGLRGAVPTVLGLEAGLYVWALFAGAGFAALVAASEVAFLVLRIVGAVVLLCLASRRGGRRGGTGERRHRRRPRRRCRHAGTGGGLRRGVWCSWPTRRPPSS